MSKESKRESVAKRGPLGPNERWSLRCKREVVLRRMDSGTRIDTGIWHRA